jgi:DNA-binding CsgD family transcriptional regulator
MTLTTVIAPSRRRPGGCCCRMPHFTPREIEVLSRVAAGLVTAEIAAELHISKRTVEAHLATMLHRSKTRTRAELVALCYVVGVLLPSEWPPHASGSYCLSLESDPPGPVPGGPRAPGAPRL